tara:strand:+ start:712 stop:894 length:183 start_codon:yes stop_codon:yes gene_type:complete
MKTIEKSCEGKCVRCLSTNLEYKAIELQGDYIYYPYECLECDSEGKEYYYMSYTNSETSI